MIVARSFSPPSSSLLSEKNDNSDLRLRWRSRSRSPSRSPQRSANSPTRPYQQPTSTVKVRSEPVRIPARNLRNTHHQNHHVTTRSAPIAVQAKSSNDRQALRPKPKPRRETAQEILTATAIPARRVPKARASQRLPQGDHVAEFSKLLFEDVSPAKDGILVKVHSVSPADGLFGNIDELVEGQMFVQGESLDENALSARSISSDSLASLASRDDYGSPIVDAHSSAARSPPSRPTLRVSHSEECTDNHPLAELDEIEDLSLSAPETTLPSRNTSPPGRVSKKELSRSGFKSTLTSSLKALKSAARTTILSSSGFGHSGVGSSSLYNNESLLAHNFFDIQPSLTDDRRPPPTLLRPSPELRRYLNPQMATGPPDSPTQLHFWQDERYNYKAKMEALTAKERAKQRVKRRRSPVLKSKVDSLPSVVPLATCLPPTVRTANASSPPIWLTPDGEPINKNTSEPLLQDPDTSLVTPNGIPRNREPRENRDFLRMYVCEMAMRKSGKLNDDVSASRAKLWLPPLSTYSNTSNSAETRKSGAERWKALNIDEI